MQQVCQIEIRKNIDHLLWGPLERAKVGAKRISSSLQHAKIPSMSHLNKHLGKKEIENQDKDRRNTSQETEDTRYQTKFLFILPWEQWLKDLSLLRCQRKKFWSFRRHRNETHPGAAARSFQSAECLLQSASPQFHRFVQLNQHNVVDGGVAKPMLHGMGQDGPTLLQNVLWGQSTIILKVFCGNLWYEH